MFSILDLMSEHHVRVSGRTIFTMTNNIAAPSYRLLKMYEYLKSLNLRLEAGVKYLLIHRPSILELRLCFAIIACFYA